VPADSSLDVDLVAAMLRADIQDAADFLELLATKLGDALPGRVDVQRRGGLFARKKTVESLTLRFGDAHYAITRHDHGPVATRAKIVRGVAISTREIAMNEWTEEVAVELQRLGASSESASRALKKLVLDE
jgi:hypothetical protein